MLAIIAAAVRRRPAQAITLFLLAAVASAGAAAAPGYTVASAQSLAVASVAYAQVNDRVVSASEPVNGKPDLGRAFDTFTATTGRALVLPGFPATEDVRVHATVSGAQVFVAYRQQVCDHLVIDGACPTTAGDVVIGAALANSARIQVGDTIHALLDAGSQPHDGIPLRVTGVFRPVDSADAYWGPVATDAQAGPATVGSRLTGDVLFTPKATVTGIPDASGNATIDYVATAEAFRQTDPQVLTTAYYEARRRLVATDIVVESQLPKYADRIWNDQQFIYLGVAVGTLQLLLLCWIALFLAIQLTADARRTDLGLLKMRGTRRRDLWTLAIGQAALPMVAGGVIGLFAGRYAAELAVGDVIGASSRHETWLVAVGAAALAVLGAVVAAVLAERRSLSESVAALGRKVSRHRSSWAGNAFDAVVVLLALGGAYEAREQASGASQLRGLSLIAPVLVALAVGLVAARLVPRLAAAVAKPALRSGRLGLGLTAMNLARRPTLTPVFALLTLVVSVFFGTALSWDVASRAQTQRAAFSAGADEVLTVRAKSVSALLTGVRVADPGGHAAMAVVRSADTGVLAVDAPRLSVSHWGETYGLPPWDQVAAALHPAAPAPYLVRAQRLELDLTWSQASGARSPVTVVLALQGDHGPPVTVSFGPLVDGRHTYEGDAVDCVEAAPCRVASITVSSPLDNGILPIGTGATLHELRLGPGGAAVIDQKAFSDRTRWRAGITSGIQLPDIAVGSAGLTVRVGERTSWGHGGLNLAAYPFDSPTPLPAFIAGARALGGSLGDPRASPFPGGGQIPVRVAGTANGIPRLGDSGVLVDLEYALRDVDVPAGGDMEVWLAADAPAGLVDALADQGVRVIARDTVTDRLDTLRQQGPAVALRFLLLVALVGVALGLGAFTVVTAAERGPRGDEFAALRRQGLRPGVVRAVSYGGYLIFVSLAVLLGVATAVSWRSLSAGQAPIFADVWSDLPVPTAGSPVVALATLILFMVLVAVAAVAAAALVAAVERERNAT